MFRPIIFSVRLGAIALFLSSCAVLSVGGNASAYRDLTVGAGEATSRDIFVKAPRILDRYQYEIVRQEESSHQLYFETRWQLRSPLDDERLLGVVETRTRLTIQARPRRAAAVSGAANLYIVQIVAENMVRLSDHEEWIRIANTDMYKAYVRSVAEDLKNEFRMSMRRF
ncbi:MAG: hypothetical protein ACETWG_13105 [Candidatus Neomarinimicrobiota bacterium]